MENKINNNYKKLTDNQVKSILKDFNSGDFTRKMLCDKYNLSYPTVRNILNGVTYSHIKRQ